MQVIGTVKNVKKTYIYKKVLFENYNHDFFFSSGPAISQHCPVCFSMDCRICNTLHTSSASQASPLAVDLPPHT